MSQWLRCGSLSSLAARRLGAGAEMSKSFPATGPGRKKAALPEKRGGSRFRSLSPASGQRGELVAHAIEVPIGCQRRGHRATHAVPGQRTFHHRPITDPAVEIAARVEAVDHPGRGVEAD